MGLGRPKVDEAAALFEHVKARVTTAGRAIAAPSDAEATERKAKGEPEGNTAPRPDELAPPLPTDLAGAPSRHPWPELNPEASIAKAWMVAEGPVYADLTNSGRRLVTLTFDDGPFPETTPSVLKLLARHDVHASFFVIGRYLDGEDARARASRETLKQVAAAGHLIGNHSHDHVSLTSISHTQVLEQIDQGMASIERVTGKRPILFRPPYGKLDDFGEGAVRERQLDLLLWSVEKQDMQRTDSHAMFREIVGQIQYKQGGIVLLHDIRRTSVAVLRELLDWLHAHRWNPKKPTRLGYEVVDLPSYLRAVEAAPLPYASRDELERARKSASPARGSSRPSTVSRRGPPRSVERSKANVDDFDDEG